MPIHQPFPRIVLAGASSGAGKTTLTVALIAAFRRRGLEVAPFKVGPDYLDPGYHRIAAGRPSRNLDGWMMGSDAVLGTFVRTAARADLSIIEGVMGLFDGASPTDQVGSTAEVAQWLEAPVVLVADAAGMARSFAALCQGYAHFDGRTRVTGSIANRAGSPGHVDLLRQACEGIEGMPSVLGGFPRDASIAFPERHLGLTTADATVLQAGTLTHLAELAEEWLDLDRMLEMAKDTPSLASSPSVAGEGATPRCRIGVAQDEAFQFYYEENLHLLEAAGAVLVPFSPVEDGELPEVDGLYLGGGYPELCAERLASNTSMRSAILEFVHAGRPVYGECGGMMYLQRSLRTADGREHPMVGAFDGVAEMRPDRMVLGYVEVEMAEACPLGPAGTRFRGHQFRYSEILGCTAPSVYSLRGRWGGQAVPDAYATQRTIGSYVHGHWASHPEVARCFVDSCTSRTP